MFSITQSKIDGKEPITILSLKGWMTEKAPDKFRKAVMALRLKKERVLVLELTDLDFCSPLGLNAIKACANSVRSEGGQMVLCDVKPAVKRFFSSRGLFNSLPVFETRDQAVQDLTSMKRRARSGR